MTRLSYRTLLLILVLLLIPIVFLLRLQQKPTQKVFAEWWNDSWSYRQAITITIPSSTADFADLDTNISIGTSSLVAASKLQSDCDDLRFTDVSGNLLPYFIDSGCNTVVTKIWVRANLVPKNTTTYTMYVYYGNPSATIASDSTTFNLYNGLVGYWNFNEGAGTSAADFSVNSNIGLFGTGVATPSRISGKYGIGVSLDGNDYLTISGPATALQITGNLTISSWIKTNFTSGYRVIFDDLSSTDFTSWSQWLDPTGHIIWFKNASSWIASANTVNDNNWHNLVTVLNNNTITYYIDGIRDNNIYVGVSNPVATNDDKSFGVRGGDHVYPFNGLLDDIRIYNRALGSAEISKLYSTPGSIVNSTSIISKPTVSFAAEELGGGPVAWWKFDEGVGTSVFDSSGHNNTGVFGSGSSAPSWVVDSQCISNKCLYFSGNNYLSLNNFSTKETSGTIGLWVKFNSVTSLQSLFGWGSTSGNTFVNYLRLSSATDQTPSVGNAYIEARITDGNTINNTIISNTLISPNVWYHIVFTANNSTYTMYINGVRQTLNAFGGSNNGKWIGALSIPNGTSLTIGSQLFQNAIYNKSQAYIDDVKYYAYARSAAQIKQDYTTGISGQSTSQGSSVQIGSQSVKSLSDGLVGYWKFDEGVGTTSADSSGNSNLATFGTGSSAPSWSAGKYGVGLSFDGDNDYIDTNDPNFDSLGTNNQSIFSWIKVVNYSLSGIVTKGPYRPGLKLSTTGTVCYANTTSNALCSNSSLALNTWYHVGYVINGTTAQIYINGQIDNSTTVTVGDFNNNYSLRIGNCSASSGCPFNGLIDEVRIYNRALSPTEVKALYNYAPGPVGYWKFDEGLGTTAFDSSGNGDNEVFGPGSSAPSWTLGKTGKSLSFSTNNYLSLPNNSTINITKNITLSAWIKPTSTTGVQAIVAKLTGSADKQYSLSLNNSSLAFDYEKTNNDFSYRRGTVAPNVWQYVSATLDDSLNLKMYLNGSLIGSTTVPAETSTTNNSLDIGRWAGSYNDYFFNGLIDDVKIYNYARTQSQILEDMGTGPASKDPILWYKFDEGQGSSTANWGIGGTLTGTLGSGSSSPTWAIGKFNKALNFSGNQYIETGISSSLDITQQITLSAWVKGNNFTTWDLIIGKWQDSNNGYALYTGASATHAMLQLGINNVRRQLEGVTTINDNIWHNIVGTFDGITMKIYVDGKVDASTTAYPGTITLNTEPLRLGRRNITTDFWHGLIDDVKIFNYALSSDEVKQEYNQGASLVVGASSQNIGATTTSLDYCIPGDTSPCTPPVAEWKFDEGVGTTAYDSSGNGNNLGWVGGNNYYAVGKYGSAGTFNVDRRITTSDTTKLDFGSGSFSIDAWMNFGNTNNAMPIAKGASGYATPGYQLLGNATAIYFYVGDGTNYIQPGATNFPSYRNKWAFYSFVYDSVNKDGSIYINGIFQTHASNPSIGSIGNTLPFTIGAKSNGGYNYEGKIDQVRFYNYARTPAQIAYDYNKGAPVGWWKMDECQGTHINDWSGNANHGTLNIGPSGTQTSPGTCTTASTPWGIGASGKINSSLNFDGSDDYISINRSTNIESPSITVSAWVYRSSISSSQHQIVTKTYNNDGSPPYGSYSLGYDRSNNNLAELFLGYTDNGFSTTFSSSDIPLNTWTHIVGTYDGQNAKIYLNGKFENSSQVNKTLKFDTTSTGNLYIGSGANGTYDFPGQIDDVRIYNYALTPTQIKTLYNGGAVNFK